MISHNLLQAIKIAVDAHGEQLDKAGKLYILHPLHVMDQVDSIEAKIVAVLHDVLEDTNYTLVDLEFAAFSQDILDAVVAITKIQDERLEDYWRRVAANPLARQVKLADIEHNSSEERLKVLTFAEANYLRNKYKKAIEVINESSN